METTPSDDGDTVAALPSKGSAAGQVAEQLRAEGKSQEKIAPPKGDGGAPVALPARLKDPLKNRTMADLPPPATELLTPAAFWSPEGTPRLDVLEQHLSAEGLLSKELMLDIITRAKDELSAEPNLLKLKDPITIVGDIHGQYYDLRQLFELAGGLQESRFLFLGDYVDRGSFAMEVLTFLFALKISSPSRFRMMRGNHESRQMTSYYNFREECEHKYDSTVYEAIMDTFDCLPVAANINGQFFAMHGGLSPELRVMNDVLTIDRFMEPPTDGLLCDLLWSDPTDKPLSKADQFVPNEVRSCAYFFGFNTTVAFLKENRLLSVIRAHEVQLEGFKMHRTNPRTGFPSVITVFSAPNYCDAYGNKAALLMLNNATLNVKQFHFTEHPYHLPNFMNVFEWSLPFIAEKITEILQVLSIPDEAELAENQPPEAKEGELKMPVTRKSLTADQNDSLELIQRILTSGGDEHELLIVDETEAARRRRMQQKAHILGRIAKVQRTLREQNELVMKLKGVCPGHRLPPGILLEGRDRIRNELDLYETTQAADIINEKRPDHKPGDPVPASS